MLEDKDAVATIAVKDLEVACDFYEDTLGLTQVASEGEDLIMFESGSSTLNVYRSRYAGTNQATAVTWVVDDVEAVVKELKARGVTFEHYDMPDMSRKGDVHVAGEADRSEVGATRLNDQADRIANLNIQQPNLYEPLVHCRIEPLIVDGVVDMSVGVIVRPARHDRYEPPIMIAAAHRRTAHHAAS